ncbi:hypothetical protein [Enterobacter bugandensis]|uniref:hypothetical protein n=1 Tax=Enterobacter bugandensis TaxID=881260 RepID=UPI002FD574E1
MSYIDTFEQPGIAFTQQLIDLGRNRRQSALPLFIGHSSTGETSQLVLINSWESYLELFVKDAQKDKETYLLFGVMRSYFDNGGGECYLFSPGQLSSTTVPQAECFFNSRIRAAINDVQEITLVAIPEMVLLQEEQHIQLIKDIAFFCAGNINMMAIIDLPNAPDKARTVADLNDFPGAEHAAAYWPWLVLSGGNAENPEALKGVIIPPSGAVIAAIQQTDRVHGVWKAPANIALKHVIKPAFSHLEPVKLFSPQPENGCSVNQIRSFHGRGVKIWGCRTLSRKSDIDKLYIQNRRLINWLKAECYYYLQPYVFEPNNEITWFRVHSQLRRVLQDVRDGGGLVGETEAEAFSILIGENISMSSDEIYNGLMRVKIGLALNRPAEFIHISLDMYLNSAENAAAKSNMTL